MAQIFPGPGGHAASKESLCGLRIARFFNADGGTPLQRSLSRRADAAGKLIMESNSEKIRYSLFYRIRDKTTWRAVIAECKREDRSYVIDSKRQREFWRTTHPNRLRFLDAMFILDEPFRFAYQDLVSREQETTNWRIRIHALVRAEVGKAKHKNRQ
jgi:hypothetical protein